ncbi:auxin response factor 3-like isoform X2 [Magnolia sinica]|uniref:auxin response factor 3-like isoform X2 n=1 Tax=Magnolia sinica TaxID=86752 RepID=UPI00265B1767|nr:auxin response factor 3-like isoform X2 [Magnolia sinica]
MGIDLNTIDDAVENPCAFSDSSSTPSVCLELWHACAGPLISLPRKGSFVVYLPQGHLEQTDGYHPSLVYELPPHVFCRVTDVKLHAEAATDEVYAQVSLLPESEIEKKLLEGEVEGDGEEEEIDGSIKAATPHMFCKTLTASDTSTHGGFSVPRRAAEDCFPSLDYKQQRPSQELVARDLHGIEWRFRHIYRGQPRRHLLTTGWSAFVNKKKLVSGDAVLFLRGESGDLRLGIRRAAPLKNGIPYSALCSQRMNLGTLSAVANAISTKSAFHIYYNPRASPSEFIIPYRKFSKSFDHSFSIGMRFKMRVETEDAAERRYTGLITGISDSDPVRWPNSKWRCLSVRWDDDVEHNWKNRVSPWEIEPSASVSGSGTSSAPGSKRTKLSLPSVDADFPVPNGSGFPDFGESLGFQKVLQGQEILGFRTPYDGIDVSSHHQSNVRGCILDPNNSRVTGIGNGVRILQANPDASYKGIGFGESIRFHKVLQGQEIFPSKSPYGGVQADTRAQENGGFGIFDGVHMSSAGSRWPNLMQGYNTHVPPSIPSAQVSSPSSVLMFQQASTQVHCPYVAHDMNTQTRGEDGSCLGLLDGSDVSKARPSSSPHGPHYIGENLNSLSKEHSHLGPVHAPMAVSKVDSHGKQGAPPTSKPSCRLFGFSLTKDIPSANQVDSTAVASPSSTEDLNLETSFWHSNQSTGWEAGDRQPHPISQGLAKTVGRSCTKVHKQGSVVGRAIDLSKLDGYDDLISELERLFNMEGLLNDPDKGWQVVYTDDEDDMMLVGDDPWQEFCNIVSKILIYTHDEVVMMGPGLSGDDAHSCSEEAHATIDVS